jgi:hypothetical protein
MTNTYFPMQNDLIVGTVAVGNGYWLGKLQQDHPVFPYLRTNCLVANFSSVGSVFRAIRDQGWKPARNKSSNERSDSDSFYVFNDLAGALDTFQNRPHDIRTFKEEAIRLTAEESIGKEVMFDVVGDYIDIGRFLDGEPECFGVAYQGNPSGLYTTILLNLSAVYHVTAEAMNHRQARILRLVDWMESQGVRCQIRGFISTACSHIDVTVKDFSDAVNMNDLAVSSHSEFLRRVGFLIDEQSDTWEGGYGNPRSFSEYMRKSYKASPEDGLTVFVGDQSGSDLDDIDAQFDKLRDKITKLIESPHTRDFSKVYSVEL